ncbi:hypothetical protein BaRGS_00034100 [Batillaria attramentaria]|uniref:Reverse transcriptase domain-containing protein n=1 Tax=Batillaria attramentaria TaxID=370345 RepID=A0ABD0JJ42_9CAEN
MENLQTAVLMMNEGCFMASVDLRHAYYSVPIKDEFRKYLKFTWKGKLYRYTCFPNGLCNCPRYFTELLKPVYAHLRGQGFLSTSFIDDCYLQGATIAECQENVRATVSLFECLGFVIHKEKSVLHPCKELKYLGFVLNSESMTVKLTRQRIEKITESCQQILEKTLVVIRELAQLIGQLVASFPGVMWETLYYRELEKQKIQALRMNKGNFDKKTKLTEAAIKEVKWWLENLGGAFMPIGREIVLTTDASTSGGWGAVCNSVCTRGRWSQEEKGKHINILELKAVEFGLKSFESEITGKHVKVLSDNSCTVAYIAHMGGTQSEECNSIARNI